MALIIRAERKLNLFIDDASASSTTLVRERYPAYGLEGYDSVLIFVFVFIHLHSVAWDM